MINRRKLLKEELAFLVLALSGIVVLGIPRLGDAAFWDETKVYLRPLFFLTEGIGNYLNTPATAFDRPPGLHFFYVPFLWITGPSLLVVRILNLLYYCLGIFFFYRTLVGVNRLVAGITVTLILLTPIHQVYLTQYAGEPQLFVLYSVFLYLLTFHREKTLLLFLAGVVIGLVRETSLALVPATILFFFLSEKKLSAKAVLSCLGPLAGCVLYWGTSYFLNGSVFHHVTLQGGHIQLLAEIPYRLQKSWEILLTPYLLIPLMALAMICVIVKRKEQTLSPIAGFSLVLMLSYVFVFSGHIYAIPRYFLAVAPFISFFFVSLLIPWLKNLRGKVLVLSFLLASLFLIGEPDQDRPGPFHFFTGHQDSREYRNVLKLHQEAISVIKSHCGVGAIIMTSWPFWEILKSGTIGYGDLKNFVLTRNDDEGLPDMILWTDYPQQIRRKKVDEILSRTEYTEKIFKFKDYRLFLYEKLSGCRKGR